MKKGILGRKLAMSQIFLADGRMIPVTVIEATPNVVVQVKTVEKEGYNAVQLGYGDIKQVKEGVYKNVGKQRQKMFQFCGGVPKKYFLATDGPFPEGAREQLAEPIVFSDFTSKGADLEILSETEAYLTVTEGKYHEVRRLIHTLGIDVISLKRVSFGNLSLGDLGTGETRRLTADEITSLKEMIQ